MYNEIIVTRAYMYSILTQESWDNLRDNLQVLDNINTVTGIPQSDIGALACAESRAGVDGGLDQLSVDVEEEVAASILREKPLGPVQLSKAFAEEQGLNVTGKADDDRAKWDKALPAAAKVIFETNEYFSGKGSNQGRGLAFWSMHMGRKGIKDLIERYSANHGLAYTNLEDFINQEKITPFKILEIKNIREDLEKPGYDRTPVYVLRIAACASIIDELEPEWRKHLAGKIETVVDSAKVVKFPRQGKKNLTKTA